MWQGHLIRRALSKASPHYPPPPRWVYTPTPDGFERFLRACVGLLVGGHFAPCAWCATQSGARRPPQLISRWISHSDRDRGVPLTRPQRRASATPRVPEACGLTHAIG
jgi:hypothetical protein